VHRQQQRVGTLVQQFAVGDRARRDDAHHLAFDGALRSGYIAHLLGNRHRFAELDQLAEVAFQRMHRHAGHHHGLPRAGAARRERDVEQAVGLARVVVEDFVEVAHAEEDERVGVLGFQAQVLLHDRGVACKGSVSLSDLNFVFLHQ